jgi:hypothetical protein
VQVAREVVRRHVDHLDVDRPLYPDMTRCGRSSARASCWTRWRA